jgi:hypothetical protein
MGGSFSALDPSSCLDAYAQDFHSSKGNLYIVTMDNDQSQNPNEPAILFAQYVGDTLPAVDSYRWICSEGQPTDQSLYADRVSSFRANISNWRPFGHPVSYCLTEADPAGNCRVQVDLSLALIVEVVNFVKVAIVKVQMLKGL